MAAFAIERHPVTNAQFAEFVADTGYVTVAERPLDPALYPGVAEADLLPGALVFRPTPGPVDLRDWRQWWDWAPGASWRHPFGAGSDVTGREDHPVVQVAYPDAAAYAAWAGRRLPTEAEFEYAARAGSDTTYAWGDEPTVDGALMANTWQGRFPYRNDGALGWVGTSPVGTFPPNGCGPGRHDRQRLGVDDHTVLRTPPPGRSRTPAARRRRTRIPASARPSRAARTCAHRSTATATGRPRARRSHRTAPPRTSDSAAWSTSPDVVNCADLELRGPSPSI